jgi:pyrroloquinoline quinone biosynthesis protein B|tara:strand:- start:844 stop:1797 length:954 start_codon:yes stop_codon:yes gene_type:complete
MRLWTLVLLVGCTNLQTFAQKNKKTLTPVNHTTLIVLGIAQDAGSPQINCTKTCCQAIFDGKQNATPVVALGLIDPVNQEQFLFEATPDITLQLRALKNSSPLEVSEIPTAIFLTHAHIGHYTGLMYLGKEVMNAQQVPVYVYPKMKVFLEKNGPWSQLVSNKNIVLKTMQTNKLQQLNSQLSVLPFQVPHRDEFSETVGYQINGAEKSALFIPDIDKWEKWETSIIDVIQKVDYAFIDATFYSGKEIQARNISEIPHPFVIESIELFEKLPPTEKAKIHFIHMNHTNPLLKPKSFESKQVEALGFNIARPGDRFTL